MVRAPDSEADVRIAAADIRSVQQERRRKRIKISQQTANAATIAAPPDTDERIVGAASMKPYRVDVDRGESGHRWLTGISEVALIDEESANRERTKRALIDVAESARDRSSSTDTSMIGGSLAANFIALNPANNPAPKTQNANDKRVAGEIHPTKQTPTHHAMKEAQDDHGGTCKTVSEERALLDKTSWRLSATGSQQAMRAEQSRAEQSGTVMAGSRTFA